ncbi:MAG: hypothetical protein KBG28_07310 [Kofleriaceae bacterium]|jgi:hypothetical protein|nr:hypothetical protein [Kofleriaceae bacterium]MBP6840162.1 hypothetical protein [Kofleriaceae bacterium]MBP9203753.1 hypothetical protein [Kofleriaceae bacterium]
MSDIQTQIDKLVAGFVADLTTLARAQAREVLLAALDGAGGRSAGGRGKGRALAPSARRGKGAKRSAGELDKLCDRVTTFVAAQPGLRIEQINKELGTSTRDLALPIRKLIADGAIRTEGAKRSTKYFPGEGGGSGGGKRRRKKR